MKLTPGWREHVSDAVDGIHQTHSQKLESLTEYVPTAPAWHTLIPEKKFQNGLAF